VTLQCSGSYWNNDLGPQNVSYTDVIQLATNDMVITSSLYGPLRIVSAQDTFFGGTAPWTSNGKVIGTSEIYLNRYTGKVSEAHWFSNNVPHDSFNGICTSAQRQF
jgi:hypothetical protein